MSFGDGLTAACLNERLRRQENDRFRMHAGVPGAVAFHPFLLEMHAISRRNTVVEHVGSNLGSRTAVCVAPRSTGNVVTDYCLR